MEDSSKVHSHDAGTSDTSSVPSGSPRPRHEAKILVLGKAGVGKTALVVRFITRRFIGDYAHGDSLCVTNHEFDGKLACVHIMDTTWEMSDTQEHLDQVTWAEGFMIVCSVLDKDSLPHAEEAFRLVMRCRGNRRPPIVLVANKCEMCHQRTVTEADVRRLARKLSCPYYEASARESYSSVHNVFASMYREMCHQRTVTEADVRRLARKLSCPYYEASARESYSSVHNVFASMYREIRNLQKHREPLSMFGVGHGNGNRMKMSFRDTLRNIADFRKRNNNTF